MDASHPSQKFQVSATYGGKTYRFPPGTDPFAVLEAFERRSGRKPKLEDQVFEEIMLRRRGEAERREAAIPESADPAPLAAAARSVAAPGPAEGAADGAAPASGPRSGASVANTRDTSMAAYRALAWSGRLADQQRVVVDLFLANEGKTFTRQEVARDTGLTINATCGRVNELLAEPFEVLEEVGRKVCSVTKNNVYALALRRSA